VYKPTYWGRNFKLDGKDIDSVALKPGDQAKVYLFLEVPATYTQDNTEFHMTVTGTSEGRIQDKVSVVVNLLLPNLKIMKVTYHPSRFIDNKPVTIEVIVYNQGQVSCENVTIRFYDKSVAGEQVIERFPSNQNKTAVFTWMPKTGQHRLEYVVDPDSKIIESNKEDNKMVDKVTVSSGGGLIPGFDALLFVVAMVPVVLVLLRRKQ
jgi:putative lipoic acid-binding regulatory protein